MPHERQDGSSVLASRHRLGGVSSSSTKNSGSFIENECCQATVFASSNQLPNDETVDVKGNNINVSSAVDILSKTTTTTPQDMDEAATEMNTTYEDDTSEDDDHISVDEGTNTSSTEAASACVYCQQIKSEKEKIQHELSMAVRAVDLFEGKCQQYRDMIESLESNNKVLQSELDISFEQGESYSKEILHLASELRDAEDQLAIFTERQSAMKRNISELEHTIELLVEDYRNATEMYMDAKDDTVTAAFDRNNVANDCIAKVQEEKADLEREFRKISKEWFQAMDKLDFSTKQHKQIVDRMNEKLTDANTMIKDLKKRIVEKDENNNVAAKELEDVVAQRDLALSTIEELAERCKLLVLDLENSSARLIDFVAMKDNAEYTVEILSNELRESDDRKIDLQSKLNELKTEKTELLLRHFEAEANMKLLSDQVVYSQEEISRLSLERDELAEEYELQLQNVHDRVNELNLKITLKDNEYQELWSKSNYMLIEKELTGKVFKELQADVNKTAEIIDQRNILFSEVKSLEHENEQQQQHIEELTNREHHLKQRIRLLENSLSPSHVSTITELQDKIEALQKHNDAISKQLNSLNASQSNEIETMKTKCQLEVDFKCFEQYDLTSKIDNMEKQLKEKDATIARLGNQLRGCMDENSRLQTDLHLSVLQNDTVTSLMDTLSRQEATIEEQLEELEQKEIELEEKDSIISNLVSGERYWESGSTRLQFDANTSLEFPATAQPHKLQQEMIKLCSRHA